MVILLFLGLVPFCLGLFPLFLAFVFDFLGLLLFSRKFIAGITEPLMFSPLSYLGLSLDFREKPPYPHKGIRKQDSLVMYH